MKAYPFQHRHPTTGVTTSSEGMDLRDYFAGLAMHAVINNLTQVFSPEEFDKSSEMFYQMADLMIKARSKQDE